MVKNWQSSPTIALIALIGVCAAWGGTFLAMQKAIARVPVMDFLAIRFTLATLVMIILRPKVLRGFTREKLKQGMLLGLALGAGYITQTYGLLYASATVSGFITGMFVVLTPVMSWLILRRSISRNTWLAVALATFGLALLSLRGWAVGPGEMLTLACAVFYAVHIVGLGEWSVKYEPYGFSVLQVGTVAVVTMIAAVPGGITLPPDAGIWGIVTLTAILATALAFLVQTWAQSLVSPTRAAVVMTMEPVFAGIFGVMVGGNKLTPQIIIGGLSIL
ncbi:MAG: DMT family transporter, partial [Dehalococcoidales bacterium]|nr:DMT family transporter [Dehalococcoidales bacterium]